MSRLLRLKCPACQTLIETSVEDELRVTLQCAACNKQFTAKVPPRPVAAQPVASRPVTSQPVASQPVSSRPVASRPVAAQPARAIQPASVDPLLDLPSNFNVPVSPVAYQPVRKRKPLNLRPLLTIVGSLMGVLLAIFLGLYIWHWVSNTHWSTFSLVPDSHQRLTEEWFERIDRDMAENAKQMGEPVMDIEKAKRRMVEGSAWSESMLVRAIRLGKAPLEKKAAYKERQEALDKKARSLMEAKLAELRSSVQTPSRAPDLSELVRETPGLQDSMTIVFSLPVYMGNALFDLPTPTNEIEKIYYEEADLVHAYLKQLTLVRNTSQSKAAADKIQELADKIMELTIKRSKLPANVLEQVPREYVSKDKGFEAAQRALVARIRRDAKPDEKLKDAVANFNDARDLLIAASSGKSDVILRSLFADARKGRSESTVHGPGDLFFVAPSSPTERDLVVKPGRQSQPDPLPEIPKVEPKSQTTPQTAPQTASQPIPQPIPQPTSQPTPRPAPESVVSAPAASNSGSTPPPAATFDSTAMDPTTSSDPPKADARAPMTPFPRSPSMRDHFMRGMQAGMQPDAGPPADGRAFPSPSFGPPPGFGAPPQGFGTRQAEPPPLEKAESVKIIITGSGSKMDGAVGNELVKRLATKLESGNYRMNASNGKMTLQIKYTGELDRVVKLIDFGKVTFIDSPERTIHVVVE